MKFLRRTLGILVMIAGILGLLLSLTGLVSIWLIKPTISGYISTTIDTLNNAMETSKKVMVVTEQALGATVDSVNGLSDLMKNTAQSVEDTKPILDQVNSMMNETLPNTLLSAAESLKGAQQAAELLDGAIKSLETFKAVLSFIPGMGDLGTQSTETYNPEKPMAESLGELVITLEKLPDTFTQMATNLGNAKINIDSIKGNLTTMSDSVKLISKSLEEYKNMVGQSQASIDNLKTVLTNIQNNLNMILTGMLIVISLFFLWLLAAQVVILSQGWELYQGTAGRMEGGTIDLTANETAKVEVPVIEPPAVVEEEGKPPESVPVEIKTEVSPPVEEKPDSEQK
jgi:predicted  nucleic acid-binding Zn-ribbon protein